MFLGGPGEDLWKTDKENKVQKLNKGTVWEDASHGFLKLNSPCEVRGLVFVTQHLPFIGIFQFFIAATRNRMENPAGGQYK